mmetsp:Transcript_58694/g.155234  ORF Transcript_58694/g.155234 Transcript_58694/m.155234 type:complete len:208 (-) Transcript_58694:4576-5199(-)
MVASLITDMVSSSSGMVGSGALGGAGVSSLDFFFLLVLSAPCLEVVLRSSLIRSISPRWSCSRRSSRSFSLRKCSNSWSCSNSTRSFSAFCLQIDGIQQASEHTLQLTKVILPAQRFHCSIMFSLALFLLFHLRAHFLQILHSLHLHILQLILIISQLFELPFLILLPFLGLFYLGSQSVELRTPLVLAAGQSVTVSSKQVQVFGGL